MIRGLGLDLVDSRPWREALADPSGAALEGCFTPGELARALEGPVPPAERLAARFAAKEAFVKAMGAALAGGAPPHWDLRDIEVANDPGGRPVLVLHRQALAAAEAAGVQCAWLSLTHEGDRAAAMVVLEG